MLKSWVSYLSLYNMATGPACALGRSDEKHIKLRGLEWFMLLLSGAQKQKDTSLGHCSILHSHLPFPVKCFPAMPSSSCWAWCKTRRWPKSHGKHLPPTGAEHYLSLFNPIGAVGAPHLVLAKSPISPMDSMVSNTARLILARDQTGTNLRTYLGPNSQNGGAQVGKPINEDVQKCT